MRVYTLIAQRREDYPGQLAPEIIDACDEHSWDEDPMGYLREKMREAEGMNEFTAMRIFITEIHDDFIERHLSETTVVPPGKQNFSAAD